jgi:hypothetical protein
MRLEVLVTALAASAALLMAGAASAQGLLDGDYFAVDDKNPRISSETEILFPANDNDVNVIAICEASTGENVAFVFDMAERPSKTTITGTKATIDKNRKEEQALVYGILPGFCSDTPEAECFFGDDDIFEDISDCPGLETCDAVVEELDCERARVKSTVNTKSGKINWSAQAQRCDAPSAPLVAAVAEACGRSGDNRGITINGRDAEIRNLKITGKSSDAILVP